MLKTLRTFYILVFTVPAVCTMLAGTAAFAQDDDGDEPIVLEMDGGDIEPIPVCSEEPMPTEENGDSTEVPFCVGCTGCGFGSRMIQGQTHNLNFQPRVWNARAGECEIVNGECWPKHDKPCRGTVKVDVTVFPGEVVVENRGGNCRANSGPNSVLKTWTYTYEGVCGTFGTVTFRFYKKTGPGCTIGDQIDEAKAVLYCNYCS